MDFALSEDQELLCRSVREFCDAELRPFVREWDEAQALPHRCTPSWAVSG